jgi:hypothetical protein
VSAPSSVIQRRDLFDLVKDFSLEGNRKGYVGLDIMPIFDTALQSGNFPSINSEEMMKPADVKRSNRGSYNRIDFAFGQDNYSCLEYGLEGPVDDALAANYDSYFAAEAEMQDILLHKLAEEQEKRIATIVEAESGTAGTDWSVAGTATPRTDVITGIKAVLDVTGIMPDSLHITWDKFQDVLVCDQFTESDKYTSNILTSGIETQKQAVKSFLGVDNLLVSFGVYNGADEGQTFSATDIWDDTKAFLFIKGGAGLQGGPAFGKTMNWVDDELVGTESYDEPQTRSTVLRVRHHRDEKVITSAAGYLLTGL